MSTEPQTLSLSNKKWKIKPGIPEHISFNLHSYHKLMQQILYNRGVINEAEASHFLNDYSELHGPERMKGIPEALDAILSAIDTKKKIVIFGDFDADGITATALLYLFLKKCGAEVDKYIPNRFDEGYGLTEYSLNGLMSLKPELVITVDCGIRSISEIETLKSHGINVIVSDHHQPKQDVPDCISVICPKQIGDQYPFKHLAGVGIAYKIAKAFCNQFPKFEIDADDYLDLVAIGTIADLAPLIDENHTLTKRGLEIISRSKRPGLCALAEIGRIDLKNINTQDIGFIIAPRLNAAGRMSSAEKSFQLLATDDVEEANVHAHLLNEENKNRQDEVAYLLKDVKSHIEENFTDDKLITYSAPDLKEGVIGLVASKLCEEYYRPVIIGSERDGYIRASCRSIPELNITNALDHCANILVRHGGHAMAAGFTVSKDKLKELFRRLQTICIEQLSGKALDPVIEAESEVSLEDLVTLSLHDLARLEPTGVENPQPLFVTRNIIINSLVQIGSDKSHLRFKVRAGKGFIGAIAFRMGKEIDNLGEETPVDILYAFESNNFNGQSYQQLNIKDIKLTVQDNKIS